MSVLIVTSLGDIVIDLHTDQCPLTTKNFLKLCKIKYFNGSLFHTVQKDFTAQTGDPTGTGTGGDSVYKFLYGEQARFFGDEIHPDLKHSKTGTVAMASAGENLNASQFYFTLRDDLDYLDGKHTIFGELAEGLDTLTRINEAYVDDKGRPYKNIRIKHTYILDDPFDDPPQLAELIPERSPEGRPPGEIEDVRLEDDWVPIDEQLDPGELEQALREKEAHSNAVVLECIGDIPDAEIKPPENVLFVCKLNPVTQDEDLDTIFSRFGNVLSAEVIRDYKTGDSLCYAFIEFETNEACEQAYYKMDNALIDDRRIHVDFSQSVSKLWSQYRRGKSGQSGKGSGCFKCGALDHIAKDCIENSSTKQQPPKYILKDEYRQHGGDAHQSYEMVFDGDTDPSPEHEKRHHDNDREERKKWKKDGRSSEDTRYRDHNKRETTRDSDRNRHQHNDKSRECREDERDRENNGSRSRGRRKDDEYHVDRHGREKLAEKHRSKENYKRHDSSHYSRDKRDNRSSEDNGDHWKRHERDGRRNSDHDDAQHDGKRSTDYKDPHRREWHDDRKRNKDSSDFHRREERDYRKRSADHNRDPYSDKRSRDGRR